MAKITSPGIRVEVHPLFTEPRRCADGMIRNEFTGFNVVYYLAGHVHIAGHFSTRFMHKASTYKGAQAFARRNNLPAPIKPEVAIANYQFEEVGL